MLQQRLGRFDPKSQWRRVVVHDPKQKALRVFVGRITARVRLWGRLPRQLREGRIGANPELLQRGLEHGGRHRAQAAQQGGLTFFAWRNVEPRRVGEYRGQIGRHERRPVPGRLVQRRHQRGMLRRLQGRHIGSGHQLDSTRVDVGQKARTQGVEKRTRPRGRDGLCEREPQLEAIDTGDRDGWRRQCQIGLRAAPDFGEKLPAWRARQRHHHRTHAARRVDQRRCLRVVLTVSL